jgi:hypothetical protein
MLYGHNFLSLLVSESVLYEKSKKCVSINVSMEHSHDVKDNLRSTLHLKNIFPFWKKLGFEPKVIKIRTFGTN